MHQVCYVHTKKMTSIIRAFVEPLDCDWNAERHQLAVILITVFLQRYTVCIAHEANVSGLRADERTAHPEPFSYFFDQKNLSRPAPPSRQDDETTGTLEPLTPVD